MKEIGKESNLKGFEQVKAIKLIPKLMSVEDDLLTPTKSLIIYRRKILI